MLKTKKIIAIFFAHLSFAAFAQSTTFTTQGNQIKDPCGNNFVPKGVNYSLLDDWNFPSNLNNGKERSVEIIKSNANTVRIMWYVDYGNASRPNYELYQLDSVISRFSRANIVSILELHDFTHIHTDTTAFNNQIVAFWTSADVKQLIKKHEKHVWLNVANEYGPALYPADLGYTLDPNYGTKVLTWAAHYKNVISTLRNAGIEVPIVIDAPNYGMDLNAVVTHGQSFVNQDPLKRIILSNHAYWNEASNLLEAKIDQISALSFPVILGEIGNDDFACAAIAGYTDMLSRAQAKNVGWLAWTWNRDNCPNRNLTANDNTFNSATDGLFTELTPYGNTIVNNPTFGLANHATKACFKTVNIEENSTLEWSVFPNPTNSYIQITSSNYSVFDFTLYDISGKTILTKTNLNTGVEISLANLNAGIYFYKIQSGNTSWSQKVVKY